jgi:branched-chain amino acid aminotransferase
MAAVWAQENKLDDAFILNSHERICDATIANIFWIKDNKIFTPALSEGCVSGVMRRRILDIRFWILDFGFEMEESILTERTLLEADEVFLTNATSGMRWVGQFRDKKYVNTVATRLFAELNKGIVI